MFEDDLTRTLDAAARTVRPLPLLPGVARLRRRRRRLRLVSLVAVVVAGLALTGVVRQAPQNHEPATTPSAGALEPVPATRLWPKALHKLPLHTADGLLNQPALALDATRILLLVQRPGAYVNTDVRLDLYDTGTGRISRFATLPDPDAGDIRWMTSDDQHVAWSRQVFPTDKTMGTEFWTVPVTGGTPTLVKRALEPSSPDLTNLDPGELNFHLGGDSMLWNTRSGIYRMKLTGGDPERVPGAGDAFRLLSWPWAIDLPDDVLETGLAKVLGVDPPTRGPVTLLNLTTGQRRPYVTNAPGLAQCSPTWCLEATSRFTMIARSTDGTRAVPLAGFTSGGPTLDRFADLANDRVVDLEKASTGVFDIPAGTDYGDKSDNATLLSRSPDGTEDLWVLNLKAIP